MFEMTQLQREELDLWLIEQRRLAYAEQKKCQWDKNFNRDPYEGCSGGAVTYSFTPTSLGIILRVKYAMTGAEIDLTDYGSW